MKEEQEQKQNNSNNNNNDHTPRRTKTQKGAKKKHLKSRMKRKNGKTDSNYSSFINIPSNLIFFRLMKNAVGPGVQTCACSFCMPLNMSISATIFTLASLRYLQEWGSFCVPLYMNISTTSFTLLSLIHI